MASRGYESPGRPGVIAGRPAFIRVFMTGDETSFYGPAVRGRGAGRDARGMGLGRGWTGALDPAFVLDGPPVLPETDGPYRVDGLGPDGRTEFSLSFAPTPLEFGGGGFVFFVPGRTIGPARWT